jgi:hypothetical protein
MSRKRYLTLEEIKSMARVRGLDASALITLVENAAWLHSHWGFDADCVEEYLDRKMRELAGEVEVALVRERRR